MSNKLNYLDKKGLAKVFSLIKFGHKKIWHGTLAEWEALSTAEKAEYDQAEVIDEYTGVPVVVDKVEAGNLNPVTSNAVALHTSPDWVNVQDISTLPFTAPKDGILLLQVGANTGHGSRTFYINGVSVATVSFSADAQMASCSIQVNAGDVLTSNAGIWGTYKFVPYKA